MLKSTFGITQEPFNRSEPPLLEQQKKIAQIIRIHAQQGGFSVVLGQPGVGKTVVRQHLEALAREPDTIVVAISRTLHTYLNILRQLAQALKLDVPAHAMENALIQAAFEHVRERKTLFTLIDEAHLLDMQVLRKLRLLFERFPKKHNLVLFGQPELLYHLSLAVNRDIKSRITYSDILYPLNDDDMRRYILSELEAVRLGINTFDDSAVELILRSVQGNLRLCRNLAYASLVDACRQNLRIVTLTHVNNALIQPHWRSQDELIKQQRP